MSSRAKFAAGAAVVLGLGAVGAAVAATHGSHNAAATPAAVPAVFTHGSAHALHPFGLGFGHRGRPGDELAVAATYLGLTTQQLLTDLQSGKTLAQIAGTTNGKSAAGLVQALVAHEKQELADAVKAGKLTQTQADAITAALQQRITDLVNGTHPAGPKPGFGYGHGWGGGPGGRHDHVPPPPSGQTA